MAPTVANRLPPACAAEGAWRLEIMERTAHVQRFVVRPWCWIYETDAGLVGAAAPAGLSKDYSGRCRRVKRS